MNLHLYAELASSVETTGTETHEESENIQFETPLHSAPALIKKVCCAVAEGVSGCCAPQPVLAGHVHLSFSHLLLPHTVVNFQLAYGVSYLQTFDTMTTDSHPSSARFQNVNVKMG